MVSPLSEVVNETVYVVDGVGAGETVTVCVVERDPLNVVDNEPESDSLAVCDAV